MHKHTVCSPTSNYKYTSMHTNCTHTMEKEKGGWYFGATKFKLNAYLNKVQTKGTST